MARQHKLVDETDVVHKIEHNVPLPAPEHGRPNKYPFHDMKVGDSFFYPGDRDGLAGAAYAHGRRFNKTFTVRAVDGGYRCWRIK